jgi:putative membrane protein insertion efficiency factor
MDDSETVERYINDPVINRVTAPENSLYRPRIDYAKAARLVVLFSLSCFLVAYATVAVRLRYAASPWDIQVLLHVRRVFPPVLLVGLIACSRFILIWFIRLYQRYAGSETRLRCCFVPSCSEYAVLALTKYGTVVGGVKTARRLMRCRSPGGIDYP